MIWHLLPLPRWQSAGDGPYVPGTEDTAGQDTAPFVHASPDEPTLLAVANDRFADSALPLVALALDESQLSAPVRFEAADPAPPPGVAAGTLFPHVYGPVELTAVTEVRFARRDPAGRFTAQVSVIDETGRKFAFPRGQIAILPDAPAQTASIQ